MARIERISKNVKIVVSCYVGGAGGGALHRRCTYASHSEAPGSILDVAEINRQHFLENGKLEYVDWTI